MAKATISEVVHDADGVEESTVRTLEPLVARDAWRVETGDEATAVAVVRYGHGETLKGAHRYEMDRYDIEVVMPCFSGSVAECLVDVKRWVDRRTAEVVARHRVSNGEGE